MRHYSFHKIIRQSRPLTFACSPRRLLHYVQGQRSGKVREYFYYIDHQGQLFLDDARMKNFTSCFKEKDFLDFFYKRIRLNETDRYNEEFPFISPCGRELNFIRCDDKPIVYTQLIPSDEPMERDRLLYGGTLTVDFEPENICMMPQSGRVYYPSTSQTGGIGLVKSSLAIYFSKFFEFRDGEANPPTEFTWKDKRYTLTNTLFGLLDEMQAH